MRLANVIAGATMLAILFACVWWRLDRPPVYPREGQSVRTGIINLSTGNYHRAATRLRRALSLNPDNQQAREILDSVSILGYPVRRNRPEVAMEKGLALHEAKPDSPYTSMILGELMRRSGDLQRSLALHKEAATLQPELPHNWYLLGRTYRDLDRSRDAIDAFMVATGQSESERYSFALAQQLLFDGQYARALEWYRVVLDKTPWRIDAEIGTLRAMLQLGQIPEFSDRIDPLVRKLESGRRGVRKAANRAKLITDNPSFEEISRIRAEGLSEYVDALDQLATSQTRNESDFTSPRVASVIAFDRSRLRR